LRHKASGFGPFGGLPIRFEDFFGMIHSLIHPLRFCNLYFIRTRFSYCQKLFSTNHHILIARSLEVCHYSLTYENQHPKETRARLA
jgi:hypothetical protein